MGEALTLLNKTLCDIGLAARKAVALQGGQATLMASPIADACVAAVAKSQGLLAVGSS